MPPISGAMKRIENNSKNSKTVLRDTVELANHGDLDVYHLLPSIYY